ncbi:MAG: cobyrinate a,c-diamide synthase [Pseudomonadota bacterium]
MIQIKHPKGLVIAAPNSNTGKTVFTVGLVAALNARGVQTQVAKAGPGFIDPQFLSLATGSPCHNLDKWALGSDQLRARANAVASGADLLIVEGVMGMFDGAASMEASTADIAETLDLPVILVVDASGQAQSIAALVHGFSTFRRSPKVCGVVATRVGSPGHAALLKEALADLDIPFLGAILRSDDLTIPSRHLGLVQASEQNAPRHLVDAASEAVSAGVDLDMLIDLAGSVQKSPPPRPLPPLGQRIAIARDIAFAFAYPHLLDDWRTQRAELSFFSPLADQAPSEDCDAVYLPGGYPELHCETLAKADRFLQGLRSAAGRGALIYGECGGYMVLGQGLIDADGRHHRMAGLLSHAASFETRRMCLGYRSMTPLTDDVWARTLRGHEFHYSTLSEPGSDDPLFHLTDARCIDLGNAGGHRNNVMGSYAHIIDQTPL